MNDWIDLENKRIGGYTEHTLVYIRIANDKCRRAQATKQYNQIGCVGIDTVLR